MNESEEATPEAQFLDTNCIARYLLGDHPDHSPRAQALIESDRLLRISLVHVAETAFLLTRGAGIDRADVVAALVDLLERENIETHEVATELVVQALGMCSPSGRVSFADAMLWATAKSAAPATVWTFDQHFPLEGITVLEP